jgi:maltodextrin utilization protein YvdJ
MCKYEVCTEGFDVCMNARNWTAAAAAVVEAVVVVAVTVVVVLVSAKYVLYLSKAVTNARVHNIPSSLHHHARLHRVKGYHH